MTSGNFQTYPLDAVWVERDLRQRRELRNIEELAESIHRNGLINPITITHEGKLVAGERRLTACRSLGWTSISVQFQEDLDEYKLQCVELEENIKRENLTWQEEVEALARFHAIKSQNEEGWTQADTAAAIGYSAPDVTKKLQVAEQLGNEAVRSAERLSAAVNIVQRNNERRKASALANIEVATNEVLGEKPAAKPKIPILHKNFHEWQETYDGPKFNLIHCDFPYGINVADAPRMSASIKDHYEDSPDIYWALLARLELAMSNCVADSAHLIFWHSMKYHCETKEALAAMGWAVNPFPLIWMKSDGAGIAPDPQRGPRQIYEAAIFATRGDRKIAEAGCVANAFAYPGKRDTDSHISEKPYPMLRHFMRMVCDEYSLVLDPTCGSGNALKVAEDLGANKALGLEQDKQFYADALARWEVRE